MSTVIGIIMWLYMWTIVCVTFALFGTLSPWKALFIAVAGTTIIYVSTLIVFLVLYVITSLIVPISNDTEK